MIRRVTDTDRPGDPHGNGAGAQAQIRSFLIADVRGYTPFTRERGDEAADIEHGLVEQAALAPVTNPVTTHAVSAHVENVQLHPQWGLLLSRLWVQ